MQLKWNLVWARMGWRSFWRSFRCGRFGCFGGGRDFVWLTLLLAMVVSMVLLLVGSRAGLMERFTDALLGTLRPHGVPVWVTSHWENDERIQSDLLLDLQKLAIALPGESFGVTTHPYRRLANSRPRIKLPTNKIWSEKTPWVGWAVYADSPMWSVGLDSGASIKKTDDYWLGLPLTIVLSDSLFAKNFDYPAYLEQVRPVLLEKKLRPLPDLLPSSGLKSVLHTLWLKIVVGDQERLLPFQTRWVHHIPGMEEVAYLFPMSTYHAILAAHHLPQLRFNPMNRGRGDPIMAHQQLTGDSYPRAAISDYARCVQRKVANIGLDVFPIISAKDCPKPALALLKTAADKIANSAGGGWDTLDHDNSSRLWLPCRNLPWNDALRFNLCPDKAQQADMSGLFVPWDVTKYGTAYKTVQVYVPDPTKLNLSIKKLLALKTSTGLQALNIPPLYRDALNRFNLLSDLLVTMVPAYSMTFGLFLVFLLLALVGTLVGHRRSHYGVLLSRGVTASSIYSKLGLQMALVTIVGGAIAIFAIIPLSRILLADGFVAIISQYQDLLPPGYIFEVLPLSWKTAAFTVGGVYLAVVTVTMILLLQLPLRGNTAPSDLLHGDLRAPRKDDVQQQEV